ncbi:MAG: hypothetical protein JNK34_06525 [Tabrizicola sp.]|nr:hypothetical protein [Tabrizicola sp.]
MKRRAEYHKVREAGGAIERTLHIYLHSPWREEAAAGKVNIFNRMQVALSGWRFVFHSDDEVERAKAAERGYGLFHMQEPTAPHILNLRRAYILPFWRIEAVAERWHFDVARARFDPGDIPQEEARSFQIRWRRKLLGEAPPRRNGTILVPLQGLILTHRSFQAMSPLAMIEVVLDRLRDQQIIATLHPRETYIPLEIAALERLAERNPRLRLLRETTPELILNCDAVVTQNSSVALTGFFANKPAIMFAESDLHHIAGSVRREGVEAAFAKLGGSPPDFARYVTWFLRRNAINGGAPDCEDQIRTRFRRHGWEV